MEKLIDSINAIKEQINILDIQIATDLSLGKENKQQNELKYQLMEQLKTEEAIYSTYLQEGLADLEPQAEQKQNQVIADEREKSWRTCFNCNQYKFRWIDIDQACPICGTYFTGSSS